MNINTAIFEANRNSRALNMTVEGYTFITATWLTVEVLKPGNINLMPDYTVDRIEATCTCSDFTKNQKACKHILWVELKMANYPQAAEAKEEFKMWEAICKQHEEEEA